MIESRRVSGKGKTSGSIEKLFGRVPKNGRISVSTGKGRIRASIENLSGRVLENGRISVTTEN